MKRMRRGRDPGSGQWRPRRKTVMQRLWDVFRHFFLLGLMSFGGPAAHLGYFHKRFVTQLAWLDDAAYARMISLSQFLPGPGSSQTGFAIGLYHAGALGGLAAFVAFTLPSFLLMWLLATADAAFTDNPWLPLIIKGLKLLAVVVVADATLAMWQKFCSKRLYAGLALGTAILLIAFPGNGMQLMALGLSALAAFWLRDKKSAAGSSGPFFKGFRALPLFVFLALFLLLPLLTGSGALWQLLESFYHAGSLVFGGGHVVLPLLQEAVGEQMGPDRFLTGYAAAQAVPGPMFSLAAFLGAEMWAPSPLLGALLATLAIFLPGFLLLAGIRGGWEQLATRPAIAAASAGINAAVVGLLIAALYKPVFTSAVHTAGEMALVLAGFLLLRVLRLPIALLVVVFGLAGIFV